uniref:Uncharacterized protein n=1 Tax=Ascaris lumbricoides TaxID=6252 RepID=A0A0M3IFG6_ASCLU
MPPFGHIQPHGSITTSRLAQLPLYQVCMYDFLQQLEVL